MISTVYIQKLLRNIPLLFGVSRFGYEVVGTDKCSDKYLMLGAFWNGNKVMAKNLAALRARKMQQFLIMAMSGVFFFYKTWSQEKLTKMNVFESGEVNSVRDQYQPLEASDLEDVNF